ncbi:MAG: glucose 1-dehydrogenase [Abditibacteriaceae bacterium]
MRLENKVALITGASSGIGKAIAEGFVKQGAKVVINHYPNDEETAAAKEIARKLGDNALALPADVSKREQVEKMFSDAVAHFGRLDIAVSNAGIEKRIPFPDITDTDWNLIMSVNLYGAFVVSQTAVRQMIKQGDGGKIIFISSVHEDIPFPQHTIYCATKGAVRMMMRNMAVDLAPHQINVNNIAPGAIATPINQSVLDNPIEKKHAISEIPWGRFGKPEEVANVAVFLASSDSDYVTGSTYYVDGGLTQQVTKY